MRRAPCHGPPQDARADRGAKHHAGNPAGESPLDVLWMCFEPLGKHVRLARHPRVVTRAEERTYRDIDRPMRQVVVRSIFVKPAFRWRWMIA